MKKKLLLTVLSVLMLTILVGCELKVKTNETNTTNETKKVVDNSHLCYKKLCFGLPNEYEFREDNVFVINNKMQTIRVEVSYKENVTDELTEYIKNDGKEADLETLETKSINGKTWSKVSSFKGETFYYIKEGNNVYSVEIYPVIDAAVMHDRTTTMLEQTLSFEK